MIHQEMYEAKRQKFIEEDALIRLQLRLQEQKFKGQHRRQSGGEVLFVDQAERDQKASRKTMAYKVSPRQAVPHGKAVISERSSATLH